MSLADTAIPPPPRRELVQRLLDYLVWGVLLLLLLVSFRQVEIERLAVLFANSENISQFGKSFLNPDWTRLPIYLSDMWLTIQIAVWGTTIAVVIAVPLGLAASRNLTPIWVQQPIRRLLDVLRSVPDLVMGTVFIVAVGLGPLAGVLALALNTGGVLAKLFSEAVEAIDPKPVEGVRATGAAPLQEIVWGVLPQVAPLWTSYALYRFESNARAATVLGLIGAGGIGQRLFESILAFQYERTAAIVLVIIVAVSIIDLLSQGLRQRLV